VIGSPVSAAKRPMLMSLVVGEEVMLRSFRPRVAGESRAFAWWHAGGDAACGVSIASFCRGAGRRADGLGMWRCVSRACRNRATSPRDCGALSKSAALLCGIDADRRGPNSHRLARNRCSW
jgi:hypothetical protein